MFGGTIAYNEAMVTTNQTNYGGYGGGICAGSGAYTKGAHLNLSGGTIQQNKAVNGGGTAIYADGNGKKEPDKANTEATLSGNFVMTGNTAYKKGGGMYIVNKVGKRGGDVKSKHHLLTMSGGARIDTQNTVYFENVMNDQIPVLVSGELDKAYIGTVGIFEFSEDFWTGTDAKYAHAKKDLKIVEFALDSNNEKLDIQENKFGLDSTTWYLKADKTDVDGVSGYLTLQKYEETK